MKQLYKEPPSKKPKYGLFKTINLYLTWIRSNLSFFLLIIFAGVLLNYLLGIIFGESDWFSRILLTFFYNIIQIGIITIFIYRYTAEKKINLASIAGVFAIMIILTIFNYLVAVLRSTVLAQSEYRVIIQALLFLGNVVCTIAVYNIFSCEARLVLKSSLSWIADNILFYAKLFLLHLLIQTVTIIGTIGVITSIMNQYQANKVFSAFGLVARSVLLQLSYFYVVGKQSENKNYGI